MQSGEERLTMLLKRLLVNIEPPPSGDPFVAMDNANDSNGEKVFCNDKSASKNGAANNGEFGAVPIKTKPATFGVA